MSHGPDQTLKTPSFPGCGEEANPERPFEAPWQAQAFAIVAALRRTGRLDPVEWAQALGNEIHQDTAAPGDRDPHYFDDWLTALEKTVVRLGMTDVASLESFRLGWERAYRRTPHGKPVLLEPQDLENP